MTLRRLKRLLRFRSKNFAGYCFASYRISSLFDSAVLFAANWCGIIAVAGAIKVLLFDYCCREDSAADISIAEEALQSEPVSEYSTSISNFAPAVRSNLGFVNEQGCRGSLL